MEMIYQIEQLIQLNKKFNSPNPLRITDFDILTELGSGSYGKVYKVYLNKAKQFFALKIYSKKQIKNNNLYQNLYNEVKNLTICDHENIIKLYSVFDDKKKVYLLLELANGGDLFDKLKKKKKLSETKTKKYISQILKALTHLHSKVPKILHRDIKPENILINEDKVKLADLGSSKLNNKFRNTFCGTPNYLAPEMIKGTGHDEKLDIWTVGVLMFELLHGRNPFDPGVIIRDRILRNKKIEENIVAGRFDVGNFLGSECREVILGMLHPVAEMRPSARELLEFSFFFDSGYINKEKL